jgi:hypothetical protein
MPTVLLAALLAAPPSFVAGSVSASGETVSQPGVGNVNTGSVNGSFGYETTAEGVRWIANLAPTLRYTNDIQGGGGFDGAFSVGASSGRGQTRYDLGVSGDVGQEDFSPLAQSPVAAPGTTAAVPINRLPAARFLPVLNLAARAGAGYQVDTRTSVQTGLTLASNGGLTDDARTTLPRVDSASLSSKASWVATHLDTLSLGVSAAAAVTEQQGTTAAQHAATAALDASWQRTLDRFTSFSLGIGIAGALNDTRSGAASNGSAGNTVLPTGTAAISHVVPLRGQTLSMAATATVQPALDPLTGAAFVQGVGTAAIGWGPVAWLRLGASAAAARALSGDFPEASAVTGELASGFQIGKGSIFRIGVRGGQVPNSTLVQTAATRPAGTSFEWAVFGGFGFALREPI